MPGRGPGLRAALTSLVVVARPFEESGAHPYHFYKLHYFGYNEAECGSRHAQQR